MSEQFDYAKRSFTEEELIDIARRRIKVKRELYSHIAAYLFVNGFLVFLYWFTQGFDNPGYPWFLWVLAGWGLGLLFHIFETIQELNFKFNANAINKELEKVKRQIKD